MRKIMPFILIAIFTLVLHSIPITADWQHTQLEVEPLVIKEDIEHQNLSPIDSIEILMHSMIYVESRGNDSSYCQKENAVGCLQIRPVMVREVNRHLRKMKEEKRYTLKDRWFRKKSIEMFNVWYNYQHSESTLEVIARSWNGGPRGPNRKSTLNYWKKVKLYYDELDYYDYVG